MKLTVWGAAQQVTGSMHLLQTQNYTILIDCGLDYEKGTYQDENLHFPFNPEDIDVIILTHAHIDHSGNLPTLIRMGYKGQILCTAPTAELAEILMLDSVNVFLNKQNKKHKWQKNKSTPKPLYLQKHVADTTERFVTLNFNKPFKINPHIELTFIPVGHLLGAAAASLKIVEDGIEKKIAFTGDIGRNNYPVLNDPQPLPQVDYLICEATYGGRLHSTDETLEHKLTEVIKETCVKNPGRLIIPAFSIGRTQSLIFKLNQVFSKGLLPPIKVFVDSPLAHLATDIYRKYADMTNEEAKAFYQENGDNYDFEHLSFLYTQKESLFAINYLDPCIIISSAGMLEGGRIQDHLYYNIQNYYCTILFIGYCAKGTLGDRLLRGDPIVRLRGRDLMVYAGIQKTDLLSGHADHNGLMEVIRHQKSLKQLFFVHGDLRGINAIAKSATDEGYAVSIPNRGECFEL